ncbi:signal peptide peptidase SppA [bacterium]|nr:signal peptide peptidase SppA [bacterium]MBU1599781.1 signal peptide peptidase SppA [bacterium]
MKREKLILVSLLGFLFVSAVIGVWLIIGNQKEQKERFRTEIFEPKEGVAVVNIYGTIEVASGEFGQFYGADYIIKRLKGISRDKKIKAVVLRINSPGGSVAASQEIYREVINLKKRGKKVVVSMGDVAASGGYYIASAADKILADGGSITGSIGVIFSLPNLEGLMTKTGIKFITIKSGKHKDIGSMMRVMTEEERRMIQALIDDAFSQFLNVVLSSGRLKPKDAETLADGRVFTGNQAKALGLVDEIGGLYEAVALAGRLAGIKGEPKIMDERPSFERILERFSEMITNIKPQNKLQNIGPKLEYKWKPGVF